MRRPEVHDILHALESKILLFPRFRSVPFATQNGCVWRDLGEKGIDVASHIINHAPVSGGDDGMETAVNRLCTQSLDTCRPQWIVHLLLQKRSALNHYSSFVSTTLSPMVEL